MRGGGCLSRSFRRAAAALILLSAAPFFSGCSTDSYVGIPLASGTTDPDLQALAMRAQAGDKYAQLELGIRYEEGRGVTRDINRAKALYRRAAATSPNVTYIYVPPVGQVRGQVMSVRKGAGTPGIPEAHARLDRLERNKRARGQ